MRVVAAIGLPLIWSDAVLPRLGLGIRGRTVANAGFATGYSLVFGGRPNWLSAKGFRYGLGAGSVIAAGYAVALAVPSMRKRLRGFGDRAPEVSVAEWVGVHIPVGTVYSEEMVFRATLDPLLDNTFGESAGSVLGSVVFGFWHIHPARAAGDSVPVAVAATTVGGLVLGWLRRRTGSALAPALLHLAVNVGGAVAPQVARD
ncbi:CPBP family intramembrane glutamic endopeptidase [Nocardia arthritidis]|uniref:CPBP family intramembrane metalloprotease n=1 Tax=Nocardia arthritidis TaxID=228602 RepID=A0A6G9Y645_9NOCA|nr:type II CAAX endopeptidase family protein [Nocardia arthritidis]QIS08546.1 CPBP family intramembrane metalloprotease [Nocardia arthritidis]